MPEPPGGFILVSGNTYFNPSTGTYWMAPAPAPAPTPQTMSQPSVVQAPPPERKVTQYALERTSTSTGKTEYATPSGGWSTVNPGPIVSTRAPTPAPFVRETSAQVTKPGDSTPQANAPHEPLRPDVVQFIETNYEGRLAQKWPGEKGYDAYIRVYDTLAKGLPETGKAVKSEISVGGKLIGNESYGYFEFAPKGKEAFEEYYPEASKQIEGMSGTELGEFVPKAYEYETNLALIKYAGGLAQKINYDYIPTIQTLQAKEEPKIPTKTTAESIMEVYQPKTAMEGVLAANLAGTGEPFANLPSKAGFDAFIKQSLEVNAKIKESEQYSLGSFSVTSPTLSMTRKLAEYNVGPLSSNKVQLTDVALSAVPLVAAGFVEFPLQVGRTANVAVQEQWGSGFLETFSKGDTLGKIVAFNRQGAERVKTGFSDPYLLATIPIMAAIPVAAKYATAKTGIPMNLQGVGRVSGLSKIELINPAHGLTPTTYGIYSATDVASGLSGFPKAPLSPQIEGYMKQGGAVIAKKLYPFSVEGAEGVLKAGAGKVKGLMPKEQISMPSTDWVRSGISSKGEIIFKSVSGSKVYYGGNFPLEGLGSTVKAAGVGNLAIEAATEARKPLKISTYKNLEAPAPKISVNGVPSNVVEGRPAYYRDVGAKLPIDAPVANYETFGKLPLGSPSDFKGTLLESRQIFVDINDVALKDVRTIGSWGNIQDATQRTKGITDFSPYKTTTVMEKYTTTNLGGVETTSGPQTRSVSTKITFGPTVYEKSAFDITPGRVLERQLDMYKGSGQVPIKIGQTGTARVTLTEQSLEPGQFRATYTDVGKQTSYYASNPEKIIPKGVGFEDVIGRGQFSVVGTTTEQAITVVKTARGLDVSSYLSPRHNEVFSSAKTIGMPEGFGEIKISGTGTSVATLAGGGETTVSSTVQIGGQATKTNMLLQITEQNTGGGGTRAITLTSTRGMTSFQAPVITKATTFTMPLVTIPGTSSGAKAKQLELPKTSTVSGGTISINKNVAIETMRLKLPSSKMDITRTINSQKQQPVGKEKPITIPKERVMSFEGAKYREMPISIERTIPKETPVSINRAINIDKAVSIDKTRSVERTFQIEKTIEMEKYIPIKNIEVSKPIFPEIPLPKIPKIPSPIPPIFPLSSPSKKSSRNWPSMGNLGKLGGFKSKRKLQPLLQPFEQLRIEQRTGKALSAFVPSTPKTRAIYAKNQFGAFGKSGLEGMFNKKKKRR